MWLFSVIEEFTWKTRKTALKRISIKTGFVKQDSLKSCRKYKLVVRTWLKPKIGPQMLEMVNLCFDITSKCLLSLALIISQSKSPKIFLREPHSGWVTNMRSISFIGEAGPYRTFLPLETTCWLVLVQARVSSGLRFSFPWIETKRSKIITSHCTLEAFKI